MDQEGDYQVIIDNGFCTDTASTFINISPSPRVSLPFKIETNFCEPVLLHPIVSSEDNVEYSWSPQEFLSCDDCPNPEILPPILREYKLQVTTQNSCKDSADVFVQLVKDKMIYVPNVFSPNLDGSNDQFELSAGCGLASIDQVRVFDRFSNLVFEDGPFDPSETLITWDGQFQGQQASPGVYVWQVDITLIDGSSQQLYGDVTVLR